MQKNYVGTKCQKVIDWRVQSRSCYFPKKTGRLRSNSVQDSALAHCVNVLFPARAEAMNLIEAILGGSLAGAAAAGVLVKLLLHHQLDKALSKFQKDLDQEKEERRSQLEIISAIQKVRPISFVQKNIEALEIAYATVASTALPRHNFRKIPISSKFSGTPDEQQTGRYFHLFSENFKAFSAAFDSVHEAFQKLEDHAIYLEREHEIRVIATLRNINSFYQRRHSELKSELEKAKAQFDGKVIPNELRSFDFEIFHATMLQEWILQTTPIREELKALVRRQLGFEQS